MITQVLVGLVALLCLIGIVVIFLFRRRRTYIPLPDGDYEVEFVETRETPQGVESVFRIVKGERKDERLVVQEEAIKGE